MKGLNWDNILNAPFPPELFSFGSDLLPLFSVLDKSLAAINISESKSFDPVFVRGSFDTSQYLESVIRNFTKDTDDISRESRVLAKRMELRGKMGKSNSRPHKLVSLAPGSPKTVASVHHSFSLVSVGTQTDSAATISESTQTESYEQTVFSDKMECIPRYDESSIKSSDRNDCIQVLQPPIIASPPDFVMSEVFWELDFTDIDKIYDSDPFIFAGTRWRLTFGRYSEKGFGIMIALAQRGKRAAITCEFKLHGSSKKVYSKKSEEMYSFSTNELVYRGFREFIGAELLSFVENGKLSLSAVLRAEIRDLNEAESNHVNTSTTRCSNKI